MLFLFDYLLLLDRILDVTVQYIFLGGDTGFVLNSACATACDASTLLSRERQANMLRARVHMVAWLSTLPRL